MGWEVITDNLIDGGTLEELPIGYRVDRYFINAFFKAFKERIGFAVFSTYTEDDFDNLLFDEQEAAEGEEEAPDNAYTGIGVQEFHRRLKKFNDIVVSMITPRGGILSWYSQEYIDIILGDTKIFGYENEQELFPGSRIDRFWSEDDLRSLLTDDTYNELFDSSNERKFKKASYWSGLYLILSRTLKYGFYRIASPGGNDKMKLLTTEDTVKVNSPTISEQGFRYSEEGERVVTFNTTPIAWINEYINTAYTGAASGVSGLAIGSVLSSSRYRTKDTYHTKGQFDSEDYAYTEVDGRAVELIGDIRAESTTAVDTYFVIEYEVGRVVDNLTQVGNVDTINRLETRTVSTNVRTLTTTGTGSSDRSFSPSEDAFYYGSRRNDNWYEITDNLSSFLQGEEGEPSYSIVDLSFNEPLDAFLGEGEFNQSGPLPDVTGFGKDEIKQTILDSQKVIYDPVFIIRQSELEFPV